MNEIPSTERKEPFVAVSSDNRYEQVRVVAEKLASRLTSFPEVSGVVLLGGLAENGTRRFVDESSDIDLGVFLSLPLPDEILGLEPRRFAVAVQPWLPEWLPNFKFVAPSELTGLAWDVPVDNHQHVLEYEERDEVPWDAGKLEAFTETSEVFYDPTGRVAELIRHRTELHRVELREMLLRLFSYGRVLVDTAIEQALTRGQPEAAHDQLNALLSDVAAGWYAMCGRFPPVPKWRMASLGSLGWIPDDAARRYRDLLLVRDHSEAEVRRRRDGIRRLLDEMEDHCREHSPDWPSDAYSHAVSRVFRDRQLRMVTAADGLEAAEDLGQNAKMRIPEWNLTNWELRSRP